MPDFIDLQQRLIEAANAQNSNSNGQNRNQASLQPPPYAVNSDTPAGAQQEQQEPSMIDSFLNVLSNNALGETIGALENGAMANTVEAVGNVAGNGVSRAARRFIAPLTETNAVMEFIGSGAANSVDSARRMHALETGVNARTAAANGGRRLLSLMPLLGLYMDSQGFSDSVNGTGGATNQSGAERIYNGATSGAGLISSIIGTAGLAGQGLTALGGLAGSGGLASGLTAAGTGLSGAVGTGTTLGAVGSAAGATGGVLAAGALGWQTGRWLDEQTGASDFWGEQLHENFGPTEDNYQDHWAYNLELPSWLMQL